MMNKTKQEIVNLNSVLLADRYGLDIFRKNNLVMLLHNSSHLLKYIGL